MTFFLPEKASHVYSRPFFGCLSGGPDNGINMAQTQPFLILTVHSFLIWFSHAASQSLVQQFQTVGHLSLRREGIAAVAPIVV